MSLFFKIFFPLLCIIISSLSLSVAYRLLRRNITPSNFELANYLICNFVEQFAFFYNGVRRINVHLLLHLPASYELFGPIPEFSAYRYDNAIREIRGEIRSHYKVLEQIGNRMAERAVFGTKPTGNNQVPFCIDSGTRNSGMLLKDRRIVQVLEFRGTEILVRVLQKTKRRFSL